MVYDVFEIRVANFIFNEENELLLLKNKRGTWGILGGHMDKGEQIRDAAHREAMEEANIKIAIKRQFGMRSLDDNKSVVVSFACQYLEGEIKLQESEIQESKWVTLEDLKKYELTFEDLPALAKKAQQIMMRK